MKSKITVYHGTNVPFENICLDKSRNKRDFGKGFYTTTMKEQAITWADNIFVRKGGKGKYVMEYEMDLSGKLKIKKFDGLCKDWLELVKDNRINGGLQHDYDVVIGPVADDNTMRTVSLYVEGIYSTEMALEQLKYFKVNNQVSLHTEKAIEVIKQIARYSYE